jgi:hypothetical protein
MKTRNLSWLWLTLPIIISLLSVRHPAVQKVKEAEPVLPAAAPAPAAAPNATPKLPPAALPEARAALKRIFTGAVQIDSATFPAFITADLNCDGSEDVAAVVKPAASRLADLNSEVANWIVQDATATTSATRLSVQAGKQLLVVIYGYGPKGWRTPDAQQSYVILNAVGQNMQVTSARAVLTAMHARPAAAEVRCEALKETMDSESGYLFWDGARYIWRAETALAQMHPQPALASPHGMR